jgi:hypothetical protein
MQGDTNWNGCCGDNRKEFEKCPGSIYTTRFGSGRPRVQFGVSSMLIYQGQLESSSTGPDVDILYRAFSIYTSVKADGGLTSPL